MESTNFLDALPVDVVQLIFAAVIDCKSLIRCMVVSKKFKKQSCRVTSLSITCPGQFSSYSQKLNEIYSMVKEFKILKSLIVRVGQPKDEPKTWARCMRYAEIGTCVEKFIFMSAKSGDFFKFDNVIECREEFNKNLCNQQEIRNNTYIENIVIQEQPQNVFNSNLNGNHTNSTSFQRCYFLNALNYVLNYFLIVFYLLNL